VGAAGAMAAVTLRQEGFGGKIIAVDPVQEEPVDRTQLSKDALGGEMPLDKLSISDLPAMGIERSNATVVRLNAATNEANLSNGVVIKFDKTLVATGGKPKRLEIAGGEFAHTIRHPGDVRRILDAAEKDKKVVIIGTSFIGLEAASALIGKGLHVTVLGRETLPFAKQFGELAAGALKKLHEGKGTKFVLGVEIVSVDSSGVTVRDGQRESHVPGDLVIMGVGVSPELDFEHDLPVAEQGGGIRTDSSLRAAQAVWVAGDIANVNGRRIEHWRVAQQHGRMAALGMLGQKENYDGVPFFWTYHFGKRFGYLGHAENWDETFVKGDVSGLQFMIFYIKKGRIRAVLNCGFESQMAALAEPMRGSLALDEALHLTA
jgi:NADPH-dependent 2,4-dienoyl-CoA reductase/sulfur reductase-like enzyme